MDVAYCDVCLAQAAGDSGLGFLPIAIFFHISRLERLLLGTSKSAAKQHCILVLFLLSAFF